MAGPAGFVYADVPNRIVAYIIDAIILGIIGFAITAVLNPVRVTVTTTGSTVDLDLTAFIIVAAAQIAIGAAYFVYLWSAQRGTLGMKVLGLQIGHETDGRSITISQGITRFLVFGIPSMLAQFAGFLSAGLGLILSLVGIIWLIALLVSIAQSPTKQGYHDRYAHTIMVKAARRAA